MKIDDLVRQMDPPRYTRAMAAKKIGKDIDTLKRWKKAGVSSPSEQRPFGQLTVGLYTDDDIDAMKKIARTLKPGRKPNAA